MSYSKREQASSGNSYDSAYSKSSNKPFQKDDNSYDAYNYYNTNQARGQDQSRQQGQFQNTNNSYFISKSNGQGQNSYQYPQNEINNRNSRNSNDYYVAGTAAAGSSAMSNDYIRIESSNNYQSNISQNSRNYQDSYQRNNNNYRDNNRDEIEPSDDEGQRQGSSNSNSDSSKSESVLQFERDNGYSVSDGRSDDSLVFSENGDNQDDSNNPDIGQSHKDNINYKRYLSKQRFLNGQEVQPDEVKYAVSKFRANMKKILKDNQLSSRTLFRILDMDEDNQISYIDFCQGLAKLSTQHRVFFDLRDYDLITKLFEELDKYHKKKLSFAVFRENIFKKKETFSEISQLLRDLRLLFDQRDQVTLRKYFQDFDKDNDGNISFAEFSEVLGKFKLEAKDIDALFSHFDRQHKNSINYEEFSKILFEDHLMRKNMAMNFREFLENNQLTAKQLFRMFCDPTTQTIKIIQYKKIMQYIGMKYQDEVLEESFDVFDLDKNGAISVEEFEQTIYESRQETAVDERNLVRLIRRQSLQKGIDLCMALRSLENRSIAGITFSMFSDCLKQNSVDIKHPERELLFEKFKLRFQKEDILNVELLCGELITSKFDVSFIQERLLQALKRYNLTYRTFFNFFDNNGNDLICFNEFSDMLNSIQLSLPPEDITEAFATFDINQDGDVSLEEFIKILEGKPLDHQINMQLMIENMKQHTQGKAPKSLAELVGKGIAQPLTEMDDFDPLGKDNYIKKELTNDTIIFNGNDASIEGKIYKAQELEIFIKEVKNMPDIQEKEFKLKNVIDGILFTIQKNKIDVFNEFMNAAVNNSAVLTDIEAFKKVLGKLGVFFLETIIQQLYLNFLDEDKNFHLLGFLVEILNPFYLFKRTVLFQMRIGGCNVRDIIGVIKESNESWQRAFANGREIRRKREIKDQQKSSLSSQSAGTTSEITKIMREFQVNLTPNEETADLFNPHINSSMRFSFQELVAFCIETDLPFCLVQLEYIWRRLDPRTDKVSIMELCVALNIPLNYNPLLSIPHLKDHQIRLIDSFSSSIIQSVSTNKINVLLLFLFFDKDGTFTLTQPAQLQKIANLLQIRIPPLEVRAIFAYLTYDSSDSIMRYFELIRRTSIPTEFIIVILKLFIVMESWTITEFFQKFAKNNSEWTLTILKEVISFTKLPNLRSDVEFAFSEWINGYNSTNINNNGYGYSHISSLKKNQKQVLTLSKLSEILRIPVSFTARDIAAKWQSDILQNISSIHHLIDVTPQLNPLNTFAFYVNKIHEDQQLSQEQLLKREQETMGLQKKWEEDNYLKQKVEDDKLQAAKSILMEASTPSNRKTQNNFHNKGASAFKRL